MDSYYDQAYRLLYHDFLANVDGRLLDACEGGELAAYRDQLVMAVATNTGIPRAVAYFREATRRAAKRYAEAEAAELAVAMENDNRAA